MPGTEYKIPPLSSSVGFGEIRILCKALIMFSQVRAAWYQRLTVAGNRISECKGLVMSALNILSCRGLSSVSCPVLLTLSKLFKSIVSSSIANKHSVYFLRLHRVSHPTDSLREALRCWQHSELAYSDIYWTSWYLGCFIWAKILGVSVRVIRVNLHHI